MDLANNPTCKVLLSSLAEDFLRKCKKEENDFMVESYEKFLKTNRDSLSERDEEGIKRVIDLMRGPEDKEQEMLRAFCEEMHFDLALKVQNFYLDEADDRYTNGRQTSYFYIIVDGISIKGTIEYFDRFSDHLCYPPFRKYILPYYEGKFLHDECLICRENFLTKACVLKLSCQHVFHNDCAKRWLQVKTSCPLCRDSVIVDAAVEVTAQVYTLKDGSRKILLDITAEPRGL